jgi:hypothetical protein
MTKTRVLSVRELNRATLDRQYLLRRTDADPAAVVEHLVGLQTQIPANHYTALWTRIVGFSAEDFSRRFEAREFVRISLQRSTIHTVTARDCKALRPLLQTVQERALAGQFRKRLEGVDLVRLAERAAELVQDGPKTFGDLGKLLEADWPGYDTQSLGIAARNLLPLVQVTPRGLWQQGGLAKHTTVELWLGDDQVPALSVDELVLRYLAAFGPASVQDAQFWCGLTRLKESFERLREVGRLVGYSDVNGVDLYDLPNAPRPDADVAAPVRFLPDYDNVFIGHKDRSRIYHPDVDCKKHIWLANGMQPQFTVDGFICGTWRLETAKDQSTAALKVTALTPFSKAEQADVEAEAGELLAFLVPGASPEVQWLTHEGSAL